METTNDSELKILCPYCNATWTAEMEAELIASSAGCDTCGYGAYTEYEITIKCQNCQRTVYTKEYRA